MESLVSTFRTTHYFLMVALLVFLIFTIGKFAFKKSDGSPFGAMEDKTTLLVLILSHIQLLIGLFLLFVGPMSNNFANMGGVMKDSYLRMMTVEHPLTMIIGVALITIGRVKMKKKPEAEAKFKTIIIFYSIALVLFLSRIPWSHLNG
ncbi:MAG: hypothetical protein ACPGRC_05625 [Salibacteraceae bacterium]